MVADSNHKILWGRQALHGRWRNLCPGAIAWQRHILPKVEKKFDTPAKDLYQRYDIGGSTDEYPYETDDIFDVDEIVSSVEKQINESGV